MEDSLFENKSLIEVRGKMSAKCQKAADETIPGTERKRQQSQRFGELKSLPGFHPDRIVRVAALVLA